MPAIDDIQFGAAIEPEIDSLAYEMRQTLRISCCRRRALPVSRKYSPYCKPSPARPNKPTDPYEMFQELLSKGCLIQEAVKRLQFEPKSPKKFDESDEEFQSPSCHQ